MNSQITHIIEESRIDHLSCTSILQTLKSHIQQCDTLVLNFKNLRYIDSSGIGFLYSIHKQMKAKTGCLQLEAVSDIIFSTLQLTKMDHVLSFRET